MTFRAVFDEDVQNVDADDSQPTSAETTEPGVILGTPADMSPRVAPQTLAIELEPFDSRMSEITRTVYGNSSGSGRTGFTLRSASAP